MKNKLHVSWLIGWFGISTVVGIALSLVVTDTFFAIGWLYGALSLMTGAFINRTYLAVGMIIAAGLVFGVWRGSAGQAELNAYEPLIGQDVAVRGVVSEDPAFSRQGEQRLKLKNIHVGNSQLPGELWVSLSSQAEIKRSDKVEVEGKLQPGFGSFAASAYRAEIHSVERVSRADIARDVRDIFATAIRKVVGEPEASLGIGYLVGQRTALPEDLSEQLRILGLTHIVVASGYNLTILVRFTRRLFARISKYLSVLFGLALTLSFVLVTGLSPSMTRAGLITTLCLIAWYFGRKIHPLVLLPAAAAITAIANPAYVWGDLGWYLSFAAFGGVLILSPLLTHYFFGTNRPNSVLQILVETTSAQLVTMPIVAFAFGQYAPLAIVSNMLILPLVPLAMIATFVAGISGLVIKEAATWFGFPAEVLLGYMVGMVDRLSAIPIAIAEVEFGVEALAGAYLLLILVMTYLYRRSRHNFAEDSIVE